MVVVCPLVPFRMGCFDDQPGKETSWLVMVSSLSAELNCEDRDTSICCLDCKVVAEISE